MKKLAVHLHLYYKEQVPKILKYLNNLDGVDYDLFVTMVEDDEQVKLKILAEFPNSKIWVVENRGYDIGPFIEFLHRIDLSDYEYVLKVHTKHEDLFEYGCFNGVRLDCKTWADTLWGALLGSCLVVKNNINLLDNNKNIGMIGNSFSLSNEEWLYKTLKKRIEQEAENINLKLSSLYFVAGTMFMVRSLLLKPFLNYDIRDFEYSSSKVKDYALAHVIERLLGWSVAAQGYEIKGIKDKDYIFERICAGVVRFFVQKKVTKSGNLTVKVCKIPVFSRPVELPKFETEKEFTISPLKYKRLAIYAAYDRGGRIDKADLYYLRALKEVADNIIYVADNELVLGEVEKIRDLACCVLAKHHGEYDFGSYKKGFQYAIEKGLLEGVDEVIFCNDSCYAPLSPFSKMFEKMKKSQADFWGVTENIEISRHIQSYFMVFMPQVFNSDIFKNFINNISSQNTVFDVIQNYEIGLSKLLFEKGFKAESYIEYPNELPKTKRKNIKNVTLFPLWLIKQGSPLVKKKVFETKENTCENVLQTRNLCVRHNRKMKNVLPSVADLLFSRFIYQKKITKNGKMLIKICKIPIYSKRVER